MKRYGAAILLTLSACATGPKADGPAPASRPAPARAMTTLGLESVIGRTARAIEAQFGKPDLDVREGTARKLQFVSQVCVLDAYLYPPRGGGDPIVTHIDARLPDGRDMDRASCAAAIARRREAR